jgi:LmbE family N-acetylglucosaminyl deacetylase
VKSLAPVAANSDPLVVLCLGAHSDDIEIGCGGTLLKLKQNFPGVKFHWVVFSAAGERGKEAATSAELFTQGSKREIVLKTFRDGFFPYDGAAIKNCFEELKSVKPDLIFTHWQNDAHQDHRLISELTRNTFRDHLIFEYEIPKYDGDMGRPNMFVRLDEKICEQKVANLLKAFASQAQKHWFDSRTFMALLRLRGMESNSASGYAEAFHARKVVVDFKF